MISHGTELYGSGAAMLHLYVENSDAVYQQALKAGGISLREPVNEFYGDRSAGVKDKWGNQWWIATHIEDVGDEEIRKREKEFREKEGLK
jgi:PhnB protein